MDSDTEKQLQELDAKLNAIWQSVEKTRKYFLITAWVTIIAFVLPVIGLLFAIPAFLNSYVGSFEGLL